MPLRFMAVAMVLLASGAAESAAPRSPAYQAALERITGPGGEAGIGAAVALRQREGLDEIRAKIAVRRDLAMLYAQRQLWANAAAQEVVAVTLAEVLGDPAIHLSTLLEYARYLKESNDPKRVFDLLAQVSQIIAALDRPTSLTEPLLLQAELYFEIQSQREKDQVYERLLALAGVDAFRVELHRARHTKSDNPAVYANRWERVLALAHAAGRRDVIAEAHDALGLAATMSFRHAEAIRHFAAADAAGPPPGRNMQIWMAIIESNTAVDQRPAAHEAIEKVFGMTDPAKDPGRVSTLHEARSELLGRDGDFAAAYRELRTAGELRRRQNAARQSFPMVRIAPTVSNAEKATAVSLAIIENALREAELDRIRLHQRQAAGLAVTAGLAAALLGLAYAYKRRSAAALAHARDAAELRADLTRWQLLRYQLNPHFLFNALSSLGGLVVTDPPAAGRVVDRLSEFCQLALEGTSDELRSLGQELKSIRAYLDVEQAGQGDTLRVTYDIDDQAAAFRVPPLLLQPLVENALKYGAQTSEELLEITLSAKLEGDGLRLEVANTGRWVESAAAPRQHDPIGLANVRERLARLGAGAQALTTRSADGWVRVSVLLPRPTALPAPPT